MRREGLNGKIALPFVVVHSGRTTMDESGFSLKSVVSGTRRALLAGVSCGPRRARSMAEKREMRSTRRVFGYEAVKTGSKIAAR